MTTDELVELLEQAMARGPVTLDTLADRAGVQRRVIEQAVQVARLEGVPIDTRRSVRVLREAAEIHALADWLDARLVTQRRTINALRQAADAAAVVAEPVQLTWDVAA